MPKPSKRKAAVATIRVEWPLGLDLQLKRVTALDRDGNVHVLQPISVTFPAETATSRKQQG